MYLWYVESKKDLQKDCRTKLNSVGRRILWYIRTSLHPQKSTYTMNETVQLFIMTQWGGTGNKRKK